MPPPNPGKPRPARIALDYFKREDSLRRWKLILTAAATLAALVWWLGGFFQSDGGRLRYSRGPVASVHAAWDDKCDACHASFQPIQGDSWASAFIGSADSGDLKCQQCHAGPPHHSRAESPRCASCHREHRGREASLVYLADQACVQCHANLTAHGGTAADGQGFASSIARFDAEHHPQFRIAVNEGDSRNPLDQVKDPGRLSFNHAIHLTPGLVRDRNAKPFRYKDMNDPKAPEFYAGRASAVLEEAVQLTCTSCHHLDAGDFAPPVQQLVGLPEAAVLPPRAAGAAMLPIVYEKHCKACHPLTFDRDPAAVPGKGYVSAPHRLQPAALHDFLESYYTAALLKGNPTLFEKKVPARIVPGKSPDEALTPARKRIDSLVEAAEKRLYRDKNTCGECHQSEEEKGGFAPRRIIPPDVQTVWLPHAKFSHVAHRAVKCLECHPRANTSIRAEDILLPGIEVCVQCHAPAKAGSGGARHDCTECHRYHDGDSPLHGIGAARRNPGQPRTVRGLISASEP